LTRQLQQAWLIDEYNSVKTKTEPWIMLTIPCPWCGPRDGDEFHYGGEANVVRPLHPEQCSDQEWANYLYYRQNMRGNHIERWVHNGGCRQWFELERDTISHEITATHPAADNDCAGTASP
jgi:heterotetrameric sarcosine oxidase delta subunit